MGKLKTPQGEIVRDDEGKPIKVDTVGATGLKPEHIKFLRKDFAKLRFPGKSGTINIATLKDPALVRALRHQIEHTKGNEADEGFVFVAEDGRRLTPNLINKYLKQIVDPRITASDFRKLKATQVFYDSLRSRKEELLDNLAELKFDAMADMKEAIVETVLDHLEESAADAQQALSHEDVRTTIESYINPRVVLHYLTNAGVDDALEKVVGGGRELKVSFDPIDFYNKVRKKNMPKLKAARRFATTMFGYGEEFAPFSIDELMEDLQEDLQL
jgi:O-acetyl-ADP-ribose deacetylase (regulator of RNase III)